MPDSAPSASRKVLLVANTSWYLYNFRRPLARALEARGLEPVLLAPRDEYSERLQREGFRWRELYLPRARLNPLRELRSLVDFIRHYRDECPVAAHHFTIKCVVYGSAASRLAGVPARINAITGLGHVFLSRNWRTALLRAPVKLALRLALSGGQAIFQNPDDLGFYVSEGLTQPARSRLVRSSGVDLAQFRPGAGPSPGGAKLHVLFAGRLLREKGVFELVEAIRLLRADPKTRDIAFTLAGEPYPGNPSSVSPAQLEAWKREGLADFPGHVDPIARLLERSHLVVLPSYREGTPKILLEACAMQLPVIATDVPGCREVVENERNGLLVPPRDAAALARAIARLADDEMLRQAFGREGRRKVEREFSDVEVARQTLGAYEALGVLETTAGSPPPPSRAAPR